MTGEPDRFYEITREERLFCAVFAHLLMERGDNLHRFVDLVASKSASASAPGAGALEDAQVYFEFTYLRDHWSSLEDNDAREATLFELLSRVDTLKDFRRRDFPDSISDFNRFFVGDQARVPNRDILMPGRWTVDAIAQRFEDRPAVVRDLCRFKWAFNIKPDIVLLIPEGTTYCIEAKLESGEGHYPTKDEECAIFDRLFGLGQGRVGQVEEQRFMFETLLQTPCEFLFLQRDARDHADALSLSWTEVFSVVDMAGSIRYVQRLVEENRHLRPRT